MKCLPAKDGWIYFEVDIIIPGYESIMMWILEKCECTAMGWIQSVSCLDWLQFFVAATKLQQSCLIMVALILHLQIFTCQMWISSLQFGQNFSEDLIVQANLLLIATAEVTSSS